MSGPRMRAYPLLDMEISSFEKKNDNKLLLSPVFPTISCFTDMDDEKQISLVGIAETTEQSCKKSKMKNGQQDCVVEWQP